MATICPKTNFKALAHSRPRADSTIVLPANCDHQIINDGDDPLMLIAAFSATPVGTFTHEGASIELPWRT
jgi:oxalate decarboxylase/phosphoglucose isomerase-like protein (cupin superfamily)